jgi:hypothetical protein
VRAVEGELWEQNEIVLQALDPELRRIVPREAEHGDLRVIAEFVEVIG